MRGTKNKVIGKQLMGILTRIREPNQHLELATRVVEHLVGCSKAD